MYVHQDEEQMAENGSGLFKNKYNKWFDDGYEYTDTREVQESNIPKSIA